MIRLLLICLFVPFLATSQSLLHAEAGDFGPQIQKKEYQLTMMDCTKQLGCEFTSLFSKRRNKNRIIIKKAAQTWTAFCF